VVFDRTIEPWRIIQMKTQKIDRKAPGFNNPEVTIYTTSTCPWCMKTNEFFKENHVKY
jgi:hypothetical protein